MSPMMNGMPGGGDTLSAALVALVWIVTLVLAFGGGLLVAWRRDRQPPAPLSRGSELDAVGLLGRRLASGEIDDDEYLRRRSILES